MNDEVKRYKVRAGMPDTALMFLPEEVVAASDYAALESALLAEQEHVQMLEAELAALKAQEPEVAVTADDVRGACQDAVEVFAEEPDADQCREVAEYMREALLALIANRAAIAAYRQGNKQADK